LNKPTKLEQTQRIQGAQIAGRIKTNGEGCFALRSEKTDEALNARNYCLTVHGEDRRILHISRHKALDPAKSDKGFDFLIPGELREPKLQLPQAQVGPLRLNSEAVAEARPEMVLDIARAVVDPDVGKRQI
jgi:hypothetical protein